MVRYNWGFRFALWCAILWSIAYQAIGLLFDKAPFAPDSPVPFSPFDSALVIGAFTAFTITLIALIWLAALGKFRDMIRTVRYMPRIALLHLVCACVGGIVAFGTYMAAGLVDTIFAVASVMFYPIIGSALARMLCRESISRKCMLGIAVIASSCLMIYLPNLFSGGSGGKWGLLLGLLAGVGWGIEGALMGRALDFTDPDVSIGLRFCCEAILWAIGLLVLVITKPQAPALACAMALRTEPVSALLLFVCALCLAFNYMSWYRSFTLIGVCRGLAVSDASCFISAVCSMVLLPTMPGWSTILASIAMLVGVFIIYLEGESEDGILRSAPSIERFCEERLPLYPASADIPIKARALQIVAMDGPIWDYDIVDRLMREYGALDKPIRIRNQFRLWIIEAGCAGLIRAIDDKQDDGTRFSEGKLLCRYRLTEFGYRRLAAVGLLRAEEVD